MKKKQVFISYKSEEFDEALWVKNALEAQGISCWMAPMCITGGASYAAEIPAAINNCTVFVLILSEKVQQSKWVPRELDQAINAGKIIMPFTLEDCELKDEFKFYLSNIQRYAAYQNKQGTMDIMSREIRTILGIPDPPAPQPPAEESAAPARQESPAEVKAPEKPKAPPKKDPAPVPPKSQKKKKKRALPIILSAVAAAIVLPVLLTVLIVTASRVTFAGETFMKQTSYIQVENRTVTDADMKALSKFKGLSHIRLTDCTVQAQDLSALSNHELWTLELEGCALTDAQLQSIAFDAMENLDTLNLNNNPELTDLSPLEPVADQLTSLNIGNTGIRNSETLRGFTKLTSLSVENLQLGDLRFLSMMVYLEELVADGNRLNTMAGLENTTILRSVSLKNNNLTNVDCLANSAATLTKLHLDGNLLKKLDPLTGCQAITEFSADSNLLTSMSFAHNWTNLTRLSLADNQIETAVAPKSNQLYFLDLSGNRLTAFSNFSWNEDHYVTLDLSYNDLTTITLQTNRSYTRLALHGNPLTDIAFANGITTGNTMSIDYFDGLDAKAVENNRFNQLYIIDCPPNHIVELEQASYRVKLLSRNEIPIELPDPEFPEY